MPDTDNPYAVGEALFGDVDIFESRLHSDGEGTDHEVVTRRLRKLIRNSVVSK